MLTRIIASLLLGQVQPAPQPQLFKEEERQEIVAYWSAKNRYEVGLPPGSEKGPWQVRLTPEGSRWLWDYNAARGIGKTPPGATPAPRTVSEGAWESWIEAKVAHDRWEAATRAYEENLKVTPKAVPPGREPRDPGPAPDGLLRFIAAPPPFASAVKPMQHKVKFDEETVICFVDNPNMKPRYAYYRFSDGVMSGGTAVKNLPAKELDKLFREARVDETAQKVMKSVSLLEGGFDSVNTYDTGFVSVGFIQFACLKDGAGSLGLVLANHKRAFPISFQKDFRRFGIDVTEDSRLAVFDLARGQEVYGADAAAAIIKDKRLIAVFQRAGRVSDAFKVAQIRTAYEQYYPANDIVTVLRGYQPISGRVGDIIKSEAGMATLMDRKVNTGKLEPLVTILNQVAAENDVKSFEGFADYERDVVVGLKYRKDYLQDAALEQPGPQARPDRSYLPSRHKSRTKGGRGKG